MGNEVGRKSALSSGIKEVHPIGMRKCSLGLEGYLGHMVRIHFDTVDEY